MNIRIPLTPLISGICTKDEHITITENYYIETNHDQIVGILNDCHDRYDDFVRDTSYKPIKIGLSPINYLKLSVFVKHYPTWNPPFDIFPMVDGMEIPEEACNVYAFRDIRDIENE